MSMSIHDETAVYRPEPEPDLDETITDLSFRIIFIHGLGFPCTSAAGKYDNSEVVGLKPITSPFDLPRTTAYTFYHGDNLLGNVNNIPEAAKALCTALDDKETKISYNSSNTLSHKRTILVCHGSGGFIAKEALLRSLDGSDNYQTFHPLILGVIFIGTPHSTPDGRLPYQLNFMRHPETHFPQAINMQTVVSIKSLLQSFNITLWSRLGFMPVSFFEELNSPGTPDLFGPIVNSDDVRVEGQKQIGLHADHWNTWNFSDPLSSTYKAVSTVIHSLYHGPQDMTAEAPFQMMDPDISGLLRSLQVNNPEFLSSAMKGTCSWIFDNHTFESWLEQSSGLLWVKGKPGSGKSTLLRYIHQTVTFRKPTSLLFFQFNYSSHTSINAMLRSLIFQLLAASPSYQLFRMRDTYAIRTETHGDYGTNWQWGDRELLSYLQDSFLRATQDNTHVVVIIDAVDEATEKLSVNSVILDILSIPSIRICASSRSSPEFPGLDVHTITLEDLNTADIIYYAKSRVSSAKINTSSVQGDLIQSLTKASDGMFLYIDLVLSNLEIWLDQQEGPLSHTDFPRSLMDLYSLILTHIESNERSRDFFQHTFRWVAFATRPLTVPELTNALAFEKVQGSKACTHSRPMRGGRPSGYWGDCSCARKFTSLSRGLISVQSPLTSPKQPVVSFIHHSVSQFLMSYEPLALETYNVSPEGHKALAWSCCKIILSETRSRRMGYTTLDSDTWEISSYALESWIPHLRKALQLGSSCSDLLSELSQNAFLESFLALNESTALNFKQWRRLTHKHTINRSWRAKQPKGSSSLHLMCIAGHVDSCERYISLGESYNDRDSLYGITPLGWAAAYGHAEVVDLLLDHGATVDYTSNGTSPLDLAVRRGNRRVVELLLSKSSSMKQLTITTQPALSLAASLGRASIVDILIFYGANALSADEYGWSPLQHAIAAGKKATLARLLSTIPKTSLERLRDLPPRNLPGWVQRILLAFGLGLCCRGSGNCSSSATNAGPIDSGKGSKGGGRQGSRKRGRDTTENMDESDQQSMAPPPQKQPRHTFELRFACPYNKRCPGRFGGACSNFGFPDMHRLKEHLFRRHFLGCEKKTRCGRCKSILPESEIQDHLILTVACEPLRVGLNYEDGFDTNQSDTLKSLKPKQFETPVHHWDKTFNTVFPDWTTDLPSPYHETTEAECRIKVAARLRSEDLREEVRRNPSNMGRVFEQLANLLDPWPRASTRPDNQTPSLPGELPIRSATIQGHASIELNPSLDIVLPTEPQRGAASSETLAAAPVPDSSAQIYRPIPPHFLFPQQVSDNLSLSIFSGTGSLSSFGPGQESMYDDTDANDASMSSWDCSFANAQMGQIPNDALEFNFSASTPANIAHSSRSEIQLNCNPDISTSGVIQPGAYKDATNTFWVPSRKAD